MKSSTKIRKLSSLALAAGVAVLLSAAVQAANQPPINMVINQSPWFEGFSKTVELYEQETGNEVNLDVTPYVGVLEKIRNSVRAPEGNYDVVAITSHWLASTYADGVLTPINDIDPDYRLDSGILDYDDTTYWNSGSSTFDSSGQLMSIPINGNVQVLYYRADLYEELGLKVPQTWDELLANAKALQKPPRQYGMALVGERSAIGYYAAPFIFNHGGSIFKDPKVGDFSVTLNSPQSLEGLEALIKLAEEGSYPNAGAVSQGKLIQLLTTGKAAQGIGVIAAWSSMDDPDKSLVVGKIAVAPLPKSPTGREGTGAGHWVAGIPANVPDANKRAALAFLDWLTQYKNQLVYTENGAVPVRNDLGDSELAKLPQFRFIAPLMKASESAFIITPLKEGPEVHEVLNLRLNQAVIGELSAREALNTAAREIHEIVSRAGHKTAELAPL
uniref:ABC transporter substrate-binding protein n=1 Tax=Marinobacterium profundum TaxID=1714300 RepID=UPI000829F2B5|nr:extracellular solute-binding protein [Marinobacterium profundum]